MPGSLRLGNVDDDLIRRLEHRAALYGCSIEAEHREILKQALSAEIEPAFEERAAELRALTAGRQHTRAEQLLNEGRNER